jgi:hypothetical protein
MGDVVKFVRVEAEAQGAHQVGPATCLQCRHAWVAVAPVGAVELTCPICETNKGVFVNFCLREDLLHWRCNCGCEFFHVTPDGYYCPMCGVWAEGF